MTVIIYKYQLDKAKSFLYTKDNSRKYILVGGRRKKHTWTVTSLYPDTGVEAIQNVKALLHNKGENGLGIISLYGDKPFGEPLDFSIKLGGVNDADNSKPTVCCLENGTSSVSEILIEDIDYIAAKRTGMLLQADEGYYAIRLKVIAGNLSADKLEGAAYLAKQYGNGNVHITSRQGVEIPFVHVSDLKEFFEDMTRLQIGLGASGPRVRAVVSCQGMQICRNGLIDAAGLAERLSAKYWNMEMPHKFKIAVTGCPSNCLKVDDNDCGIKGVSLATWQSTGCRYCGICEKKCERGAIEVQKNEQRVVINEETCIKCGKCQNFCPFNCISTHKGYRLSFGGTFGKELIIGKPVCAFVHTEEEVACIIQRAVDFYKQHGKPKERLAKTIERMGWENFADYVRS